MKDIKSFLPPPRPKVFYPICMCMKKLLRLNDYENNLLLRMNENISWHYEWLIFNFVKMYIFKWGRGHFWFWTRMEKIWNFFFNLKTCHAMRNFDDLGPYGTSWHISSTSISHILLQFILEKWKIKFFVTKILHGSLKKTSHFGELISSQIEFKVFLKYSLYKLCHCVERWKWFYKNTYMG